MTEQELAGAIVETSPGAALNALRAPLRPWTGVAVHHSYAPHLPEWGVNYAVAFNRFHYRYRRWERGLGYHLLLSWNTAEPGQQVCWASGRWTEQWDGAHAVNRKGTTQDGRLIAPNADLIGVCIVGDYSSHDLPDAVYAGLARLLRPILQVLPPRAGRRLYRHDDFQDKDCPGQRFDLSRLAGRLSRQGPEE